MLLLDLKIYTKMAEIFLIMVEKFQDKERAQLEIITKRKENTLAAHPNKI